MSKYNLGININTDEDKIEINKMLKKDLNEIININLSKKLIHVAYNHCRVCRTLFMLFEFFENYHDIIMILPEFHTLKKAISIKLDEFINKIISQKDTICSCNLRESVDYIDEYTGRIYLVEKLYEDSLHYHYDILCSNPYFVNQAYGKNYFNRISNCEVMDDNFLRIIFNEDDTLNPYDPQYETPYNTRIHYRLKNKNFLKLVLDTLITKDGKEFTDSIIYRDLDMVIDEIKFWREYFRQPHKCIIVTMMTLNRHGINMDCISNIIKFI